jgi:hypothetical protein
MSYFFDFEPPFEIWKDFKKECKKYHKENIKNLIDLIKNNKLSKKELDYVYKNYNIKF